MQDEENHKEKIINFKKLWILDVDKCGARSNALATSKWCNAKRCDVR